MDSQTDAIIGTVSNIKVLQEACILAKRNIKIICLKTEAEDSIPEGTIDFNELISLKGEFQLFIKFHFKLNFFPFQAST